MSLQLKQYESTQTLDGGSTIFTHPLAFAATLVDNETFHFGDVIEQPDRPPFIKAMIKEIDNLTKTGVRVLQKCTEIGRHSLVKAIWSLKCKRAPNGQIIKHKARLCTHGGMQIHGEHSWETYSPVVQMTTVCLMLILSLLLGLQMRSIDFTLAFTQAPIDVGTSIEIPTGFKVPNTNEEYILELKKTLFGLHRTGLNWLETLRNHLTSIGFRQSTIDPCCFIKDNLILLCYVDDCLIFCHDNNKIDELIKNLSSTFTLSDEGDVVAYLGVDIHKQTVEGKP